MIKRTSKKYIEKILAENKEWKVLDIGCGYSANKYASTICDVQDLSNFYKDKKFIKLEDKKLPFKDNEFDFVIASHVMEHVQDIDYFIKELERISKKGYIEVPTKLEDNLVFENEKDHLWHIEYDDIKSCFADLMIVAEYIFTKYPNLEKSGLLLNHILQIQVEIAN